jgi:hypothetical protein
MKSSPLAGKNPDTYLAELLRLKQPAPETVTVRLSIDGPGSSGRIVTTVDFAGLTLLITLAELWNQQNALHADPYWTLEIIEKL